MQTIEQALLKLEKSKFRSSFKLKEKDREYVKNKAKEKSRGFPRDFRLSKNLYNEKGRPPYPYQSAKSRDLCVAFCTSQGRGAPLVRWPDGHTFFGPVSGRPYFLCFSAYNRPGAGAQYGSGGSPPARERSMGAEALRQPLAKTRKSGLSHFFDTLRGEGFPSD